MNLSEIVDYVQQYDPVVKAYGPVLLRLGMAAVFLYFGISQLVNPESFIGWLPKEVALIPIEPRTFVLLNGAFETFFGTLLTLGIWTRIGALLLGLHLLGITVSIGFTEVGVRDFGLSIASLTLAAIGCDRFNLFPKEPTGAELRDAMLRNEQ